MVFWPPAWYPLCKEKEGDFMMNQEKTGKFIAGLRKEKKMTQEQLAEKLALLTLKIKPFSNLQFCFQDSHLPVL